MPHAIPSRQVRRTAKVCMLQVKELFLYRNIRITFGPYGIPTLGTADVVYVAGTSRLGYGFNVEIGLGILSSPVMHRDIHDATDNMSSVQDSYPTPLINYHHDTDGNLVYEAPLRRLWNVTAGGLLKANNGWWDEAESRGVNPNFAPGDLIYAPDDCEFAGNSYQKGKYYIGNQVATEGLCYAAAQFEGNRNVFIPTDRVSGFSPTDPRFPVIPAKDPLISINTPAYDGFYTVAFTFDNYTQHVPSENITGPFSIPRYPVLRMYNLHTVGPVTIKKIELLDPIL